MATIDDIIQRAQQVRDNTAIGSNTAPLVGGVMTDTAEHLRGVESGVAGNTTDITDLKGRMTTAEGDITTLQETVAGHTEEIEALQETLDVIDDVPTANSDNLVKSGGVEKYLAHDGETLSYVSSDFSTNVYIANDESATVGQMNNYRSTPVIHLEEGQTISLPEHQYINSTLSVITQVVTSGGSTTYRVLVKADGWGDYLYTAGEDMDVVITAPNTVYNFYRGKIERAAGESSVAASVASINQQLTALGTTVGGHTSSITTINGKVATLEGVVRDTDANPTYSSDDLVKSGGVELAVASVNPDISDVRTLINGNVLSETLTTVVETTYRYKRRGGKFFNLKANVPYRFVISSQSALSANVYMRVMTEDGDGSSYISGIGTKAFETGVTELSFDFMPSQDYNNVFIGLGSSIVATLSVSVYTDESLNKRIVPKVELHDSLLTYPAMKAARFDDGTSASAFQWDGGNMRFPCTINGNAEYRGKKIVRVEFYANKSGKIKIVKGTITSGAAPVYTELQESDISLGFNSVNLNQPLTIQAEDEYIGFSTDNKLGYNGVYSNQNVYYWYLTANNVMAVSTKEILVNIVTSTVNDSSTDTYATKEYVASHYFDKEHVLLPNPFADCHFLHHNSVEFTTFVVPSQSLWDIALAKKLGYKYIEVNPQRCSDGVYVCKHGSSNKLGAGLVFADGSNLTSETLFADVSSTTLREEATYNSQLAKYRGHIPTLDEFCMEANRQGLGVLIGPLPSSIELDGALDVARKYLPDSRIIAYAPTQRGDFTGYIINWASAVSAENALSVANSYGRPFIFGMSDFNTLTDATIKDIVETLHTNGYLVGTAYIYGSKNIKALGLGVDIISSVRNVTPEILSGNLLNIVDTDEGLTLSSGVTFDSTTKVFDVPSGGKITISNNDYADKIIQMSVRIQYNGRITMNIGKSDNTYYNIVDLESDGTTEIVYSAYSELLSNVLRIEATSATQILGLRVIASEI